MNIHIQITHFLLLLCGWALVLVPSPVYGQQSVKQYRNSIFKIHTTTPEAKLQGTGFFVEGDAPKIAVSARHVIPPNAKKVYVELADGQKYKIHDTVLYNNIGKDIVGFLVDAPKNLQKGIPVPTEHLYRGTDLTRGDKLVIPGYKRGVFTYDNGRFRGYAKRPGIPTTYLSFSSAVDHGQSGAPVLGFDHDTGQIGVYGVLIAGQHVKYFDHDVGIHPSALGRAKNQQLSLNYPDEQKSIPKWAKRIVRQVRQEDRGRQNPSDKKSDEIGKKIWGKGTLAKTYYMNGMDSKALQILDDLISKYPDHPEIERAKYLRNKIINDEN